MIFDPISIFLLWKAMMTRVNNRYYIQQVIWEISQDHTHDLDKNASISAITFNVTTLDVISSPMGGRMSKIFYIPLPLQYFLSIGAFRSAINLYESSSGKKNRSLIFGGKIEREMIDYFVSVETAKLFFKTMSILREYTFVMSSWHIESSNMSQVDADFF